MLIMKIFFALLILICAFFYIMYLWDFAIVLLIVMIAVPIIMFIAGFIAKRSISTELTIDSSTSAKNQGFTAQLMISNRSFIPVGRAEALIEYFNSFDRKKNDFRLFLPIQSRNTQSLAFQLSSKFSGIVNIRCACITVFDPLKIFKFRVKCNIVRQIVILPDCHEISGQVNYTDRINEESNVFSEHKPGDDPSEIFDLRGYNPGDKLNRIHWKLSSKKDEFIVKDYSLPVDVPSTVFVDMRYDRDSVYAMPVYDTLVETLLSVSQFMLENERLHSVVFFNAKSNSFTEINIKDSDSLAEAIQELISSASDVREYQSPSLWFAEKNSISLASFIFISADPEPSVMEFIEDSVDADLKNALIVTKSSDDAAELSSGYSSIDVMPVIIGRITSSVKDIEV